MDKSTNVGDKTYKYKIERRPMNPKDEKKRNKIAGTIDDDIDDDVDDESSVTMNEDNW